MEPGTSHLVAATMPITMHRTRSTGAACPVVPSVCRAGAWLNASGYVVTGYRPLPTGKVHDVCTLAGELFHRARRARQTRGATLGRAATTLPSRRQTSAGTGCDRKKGIDSVKP